MCVGRLARGDEDIPRLKHGGGAIELISSGAVERKNRSRSVFGGVLPIVTERGEHATAALVELVEELDVLETDPLQAGAGDAQQQDDQMADHEDEHACDRKGEAAVKEAAEHDFRDFG